jgi:hypothetical protein
MQLVNAHIYPTGTFLLGRDRKNTPHGVFCWSAEQIALIASDWRLTQKDERRLGEILLKEEISITANQEPQLIHGIGAALIDEQFKTLQNIRDITKPGTTIPLTRAQIYHQVLSHKPQEQEAALLFYITPKGEATLAHIRTQDQAAELFMWEDWMQESGVEIIHSAMCILPENDRFNQHITFESLTNLVLPVILRPL